MWKQLIDGRYINNIKLEEWTNSYNRIKMNIEDIFNLVSLLQRILVWINLMNTKTVEINLI